MSRGAGFLWCFFTAARPGRGGPRLLRRFRTDGGLGPRTASCSVGTGWGQAPGRQGRRSLGRRGRRGWPCRPQGQGPASWVAQPRRCELKKGPDGRDKCPRGTEYARDGRRTKDCEACPHRALEARQAQGRPPPAAVGGGKRVSPVCAKLSTSERSSPQVFMLSQDQRDEGPRGGCAVRNTHHTAHGHGHAVWRAGRSEWVSLSVQRAPRGAPHRHAARTVGEVLGVNMAIYWGGSLLTYVTFGVCTLATGNTLGCVPIMLFPDTAIEVPGEGSRSPCVRSISCARASVRAFLV